MGDLLGWVILLAMLAVVTVLCVAGARRLGHPPGDNHAAGRAAHQRAAARRDDYKSRAYGGGSPQ